MFSKEILWFLFRAASHLKSRPFCGWKKSVERKKQRKPIRLCGPVGSWLPRKDRNAPVAPAKHPSMADQINIALILSVIKDAVAAGMTKSAETNTTPTTLEGRDDGKGKEQPQCDIEENQPVARLNGQIRNQIRRPIIPCREEWLG